ncbi:MAG: hypothetical protein ACXVZX_15525 [Terriglobales bacterium]
MITYKLDAPRCQHVHPNGMRCGSPALRSQPFCYNHDQIYNPRALPGQKPYKFPALETQAAMEIVVRQVLQAYHDNQITTEQTRTYFYGLQLLMPHVCKGNSPYAPAVQTELTPAMQALANAQAFSPKSLCGESLCTADTPVRGTHQPATQSPTATAAPCAPNHQITRSPDHQIVLCTADIPVRESHEAATNSPTLTTETPTSDRQITRSPDHQMLRKPPTSALLSSGDLARDRAIIQHGQTHPEFRSAVRRIMAHNRAGMKGV